MQESGAREGMQAESRVVAPASEEALAATVPSDARYTPGQMHRAKDLLARVYGARRAIRFYPGTHPVTKDALERLAAVAKEYHDEGRPVSIRLHEGEVFLGEQLLPEETSAFSQLIFDLEALGVGSITIEKGVTTAEIEALIAVLAADAAEVEAAGGPARMLESLGATRVRIATFVAAERVMARRGESAELAWEAYSGAIDLLREVDKLAKGGGTPPSPGQIHGSVRSLVDNVLTNRTAMLKLAGLKDYDEYTYYHSANVAILSLVLGSMITSDQRFLASLGAGALMHDIGKLSVELEILNKKGSLSSEEWEKLEEHPQIGAAMVAAMPGTDSTAIVTILEHHMRYDGSGYPKRVPERPQHLSGRIVAIADAFDAMTSRRSYSPALMQDEAMATLMESAGTKLDPELVKLFVRALGVFPPRSLVLLSDGRIAVVLAPCNDDPMRPLVRVITSAGGDLVEPIDIDLCAQPEYAVDRCIDPELVAVDIGGFL